MRTNRTSRRSTDLVVAPSQERIGLMQIESMVQTFIEVFERMKVEKLEAHRLMSSR